MDERAEFDQEAAGELSFGRERLTAGQVVLESEGKMGDADLGRQWAIVLLNQERRFDVDLSVPEIVDLISTSRVRHKIAVDKGLADYEKSWYSLRNKALLKAVKMRSEGNRDIRIVNEVDSEQLPEYQNRLKFGFRMGDAVFRTSISVVTFTNSGDITYKELMDMVGQFDQNTVFDDVRRDGNRGEVLKSTARFVGSEEERISSLLARDLSSGDIADIIFKINNRIGYLGLHKQDRVVQFSSSTRHRFLMQAAILKKGGVPGIKIGIANAKNGEGEEYVFAFDRKGKPPFKTRVKTKDLEGDFPNFCEFGGPFEELPAK